MLSKQVLCGLISRGGVFAEIEGTTVADVYLAALRKMHLPDYLSPEVVQAELLERAGGAMRCAVGQADRRTKIHKGLVEGAGV